jgi:hypothetical protein
VEVRSLNPARSDDVTIRRLTPQLLLYNLTSSLPKSHNVPTTTTINNHAPPPHRRRKTLSCRDRRSSRFRGGTALPVSFVSALTTRRCRNQSAFPSKSPRTSAKDHPALRAAARNPKPPEAALLRGRSARCLYITVLGPKTC